MQKELKYIHNQELYAEELNKYSGFNGRWSKVELILRQKHRKFLIEIIDYLEQINNEELE